MGSEGVKASSGVQEGDNKVEDWDYMYPLGCVPIVSSPIGLYHIAAGTIQVTVAVYYIATTFFAAQWNYWTAESFPEDHIIHNVKDEELVYLSEAIDTIARGLLELIPIFGNLAIYESRWGCEARFKVELEHKAEELRGQYAQAIMDANDAYIRLTDDFLALRQVEIQIRKERQSYEKVLAENARLKEENAALKAPK